MWERIESKQKPGATRERIRGFMSFTPESNVTGTIEAVRVKENGKGYFLIRATKATLVNVQDDDSLTGQGKAQIGELIGIRKTGATKVLSEFALGTLVSVTYIEMTEKPSFDPKLKQIVQCPFHNISIDVFRPETQGVA